MKPSRSGRLLREVVQHLQQLPVVLRQEVERDLPKDRDQAPVADLLLDQVQSNPDGAEIKGRRLKMIAKTSVPIPSVMVATTATILTPIRSQLPGLERPHHRPEPMTGTVGR
ncbi:MAG: hypothetical protein ACK58L_05880 [Planctomycetota bacterium]